MSKKETSIQIEPKDLSLLSSKMGEIVQKYVTTGKVFQLTNEEVLQLGQDLNINARPGELYRVDTEVPDDEKVYIPYAPALNPGIIVFEV